MTMKTITRACLLGASLIASFANSAHAVPIAFEFSGTVSGSDAGHMDWRGQTATGRFVLETDNFTALSPLGRQVTWTDTVSVDVRPSPMIGSLRIGDELISLNSEVESYGGINFVGGCAMDCPATWIENWGVFMNTQSFALGQPIGDAYRLSGLRFFSDGPINSDFIPDSGLTPLDILSLPLGLLTGSYSAFDYLCTNGECIQSGFTLAHFRVTSVTRVQIEPTPVPEPGALTLLAASLSGVAFVRRRRPS